MKMKPEHYKHVESEIIRFLDTEEPRLPGHIAHVICEGKYKDLKKRIRWDIFYAAHLSKYACKYLYSYLDDAHIDTALRTVFSRHDYDFYDTIDYNPGQTPIIS